MLFDLVEQCSRKLNSNARFSVEEKHHISKKDSPSGTALAIKNIVGSAEITARREKEVVGTHKLNILLGSEELTIEHKAFSRKAFASGALEAAKILVNKPPNFYRLSDIFC